MIDNYWLRPEEIRTPERPAPLNFAFRRSVDARELAMTRSLDERKQLFERLKRHAAHALADHIAKHCKWFEIEMPDRQDLTLQLELTISDRGAYENWLPFAHQQGVSEGDKRAVKRLVESLPYGLADAAKEFYE